MKDTRTRMLWYDLDLSELADCSVPIHFSDEEDSEDNQSSELLVEV